MFRVQRAEADLPVRVHAISGGSFVRGPFSPNVRIHISCVAGHLSWSSCLYSDYTDSTTTIGLKLYDFVAVARILCGIPVMYIPNTSLQQILTY
jgi:hypothetical protein